ncbi:hypothetical protein WMF04_00645 [Sorangium sp. So ce260]
MNSAPILAQEGTVERIAAIMPPAYPSPTASVTRRSLRTDVPTDHRVDVVVGDLEQGAADASTHVVDPDVDATELRDCLVEYALHVVALRHVGDDGVGLAPTPLGHFAEGAGAARGQHDRRATSRELLGRGSSDTTARPGDDNDVV